MQIADGVHRLGTGLVNAYLLVDGGAITVIDAGLPGYWSDLQAELASIDCGLEDIRAVVLTHGHSDHIGFAERARRERGVTVSVHEADALLARGKVKNPAKGTGPVRPLPLFRFIALALRKGGWHIDRLREVATFGDGANLDVPGSPQVILVPGHTPGSAALHVPARGLLFVGDAFATTAVTTGETGPRLAPFTADAPQALESLERLRGLEGADLLLPGHGAPWLGGIDLAIDRVRLAAATAGSGRR
jgi:glyoxylase-like metal-dependent hydrolase (beta-lactamase superfamily II)